MTPKNVEFVSFSIQGYLVGRTWPSPHHLAKPAQRQSYAKCALHIHVCTIFANSNIVSTSQKQNKNKSFCKYLNEKEKSLLCDDIKVWLRALKSWGLKNLLMSIWHIQFLLFSDSCAQIDIHLKWTDERWELTSMNFTDMMQALNWSWSHRDIKDIRQGWILLTRHPQSW